MNAARLYILSYIVEHYQQQEDVFRPLETLPLVCKSWSETALGNRALWAPSISDLGKSRR